MRLNPARLLEYEHRLKLGSLDVREFGTVLHSDWGIHPPADVVAFMRDTYGVETPEDDED